MFTNRKLHKDWVTFFPNNMTGQKQDLTEQKIISLNGCCVCNPLKIILSPGILVVLFKSIFNFDNIL